MSTTEKLLELAHRLAAMVSTRQVRAGDAVQTMVDAIESVFVDDAQGTETLISLLSDQYDRINAAALPYRVEYATLVASVALRFPFPKWIGWTHHDLGKLLNSLGRHREAKASFETAIASWGAAYPDFVDVARGDLGATMRLLGEFTTAEPLLREALEAASRAGSIHNVLQWSLELGNTLTFTSRNREADEIFRRGLELARLTSNPAMEAAILTGLANVRENEGRYDECIGYHEAALARVREHPGVDTVSARRRIGDAAIARGRYPF